MLPDPFLVDLAQNMHAVSVKLAAAEDALQALQREHKEMVSHHGMESQKANDFETTIADQKQQIADLQSIKVPVTHSSLEFVFFFVLVLCFCHSFGGEEGEIMMSFA